MVSFRHPGQGVDIENSNPMFIRRYPESARIEFTIMQSLNGTVFTLGQNQDKHHVRY